MAFDAGRFHLVHLLANHHAGGSHDLEGEGVLGGSFPGGAQAAAILSAFFSTSSMLPAM
jgi:hypothetical protein